MKAKLVIFDLDGTLLDSIDDLAASTNHALQLHGYPQHERATYRYFVGNGVRKLIERALPEDARQARTTSTVSSKTSSHTTKPIKPFTPTPTRASRKHWHNCMLQAYNSQLPPTNITKALWNSSAITSVKNYSVSYWGNGKAFP